MNPRVTLYIRPGCHLCDDARATVQTVCAEASATWTETDIDAPGNEPLRARLSDLVPVVEVDGQQVGYWRIRASAVRSALARHGGQ